MPVRLVTPLVALTGIRLPRRAFVAVHPAWRERLSALGLKTADDFLNHPGEIISGHPDRHVIRTAFGATAVYLKREHRVPWRDRLASWRAGFGLASVSAREARTLQLLVAAGLPAPEWIAAGEDGRGRAFLALRAVDEAVDLRRYLLSLSQQPVKRRALARRLGYLISAVHNAGFEYPDLYAKHVLVAPASGEFTLLACQRSGRPRARPWRARARGLAALHASLAEDLASPAQRFAFLRAYLRRAVGAAPPFGRLCRMIEKRTAVLLRRSSVREQRLPAFRDSQTLVWLDGEALAVTPGCRGAIAHTDLARLAYALPLGGAEIAETEKFDSRDGRPLELSRRRTVRRLGRLRDLVRGRRWAAPESRAAADLLRRERLGEPARLLAFGQREVAWGVVESFLLRQTGDE